MQPCGLTPVLSDALRVIRIPHADRVGEFDLVFQTRLGRGNNATFAIKNGCARLVVGDGRRPSGPAPLQHDVCVKGGALTWDASHPDSPRLRLRHRPLGQLRRRRNAHRNVRQRQAGVPRAPPLPEPGGGHARRGIAVGRVVYPRVCGGTRCPVIE